MKLYIISQSIFSVVIFVLFILQQVIDSQNKIIGIVLWIIMGIVFLGMIFVQGYIQGSNNLNDSFVTASNIITASIFMVLGIIIYCLKKPNI